MADDTVKENKQFLVLRVLNFLSPRFFSFTVPVGGERFINLFFRFLDFSGKNVKVF
jgi:hypothetical protein